LSKITEYALAKEMGCTRKHVATLARRMKIKPERQPFKYVKLYSRAEAKRIKKASASRG